MISSSIPLSPGEGLGVRYSAKLDLTPGLPSKGVGVTIIISTHLVELNKVACNLNKVFFLQEFDSKIGIPFQMISNNQTVMLKQTEDVITLIGFL